VNWWAGVGWTYFSHHMVMEKEVIYHISRLELSTLRPL
jgi:hypothetical protein